MQIFVDGHGLLRDISRNKNRLLLIEDKSIILELKTIRKKAFQPSTCCCLVTFLDFTSVLFFMLTSLGTYVLGSCCLGLANVSCRCKCSCIFISICICICRSMCRCVCSRGVYVMWQLLASLLSHTATLSIYLCIFCTPFWPTLHELSIPPPICPPSKPATATHLPFFLRTSCTILLRFALHFVDSFVNKRWKLAKYKYMYCTHPSISPRPCRPPGHFPFGFVSFVAMCAGIFITTATTRSHRILFINANINRCKMHRFHLPKSAMIRVG